MKKYKHRADQNQNEIVKLLRQIPGVTVEKGHDDILVGYKGITYWFEIKRDGKASLTRSEELRKEGWRGHYSVVWSLEQILKEILTPINKEE